MGQGRQVRHPTPLEPIHKPRRRSITRPWFICPGQGCGRRVGVLYAGRLFLCRHCRQLAYESQREAPVFRALSRVQDMQARMGWRNMCADDGLPPRKKGMHKRTYERLAQQFEWAERMMNLEAASKFGVALGAMN